MEARYLQWLALPQFAAARLPDRNARVAAAVGSHTLLLLSGSLSVDAQIAGRHADVRFEYLTCPPDGDWVRLFSQVQRESPWLLLNSNGSETATGPMYESALGRPCPNVPVVTLRQSLAAAGWHLAFEENGYDVWSAEPARRFDEPK